MFQIDIILPKLIGYFLFVSLVAGHIIQYENKMLSYYHEVRTFFLVLEWKVAHIFDTSEYILQ